MSYTAIRVENLGKQYQIGAARPRYNSLRDTLSQAVGSPFRAIQKALTSPKPISKPATNQIWALKDVSFEVQAGEVLGIIGRNGAGKSTLLKVLSRITEPTTGEVDLVGRVGSLLEVGTGFHPELTGRENVFLNGAILGMQRTEIQKKFDEIVDFAELEKFIDTTVKHYSSGMYMRLAFAVAAHLEPEILLVDEVLAVGDAEFQKKCLGKMSTVAHEGRTVLLISHNMIAIQQLSEKCLWLDGGQVKEFGNVNDVITSYSRSVFSTPASMKLGNVTVKGDGRVELLSYQVCNNNEQPFPLPVTNEDIVIRVLVRAVEAIQQFACGISLVNERGILMTSINTVEQGNTLPPLPAGESEITIRLCKPTYLPGVYLASFWCMSPQGHIYAHIEDALVIEIAQSPIYGTSQVDHRWGCVYTKVEFSNNPLSVTG